MEDDRVSRHDDLAQRLYGFGAPLICRPGRVWSVNADDAAVFPEREVKDRRVAEPDDRLWISASGVEVDSVGDSVCAFPAAGCEDGADSGVVQRVVQISRAMFVGAGKKAELVERVRPEFDLQSPAFDDPREASERPIRDWVSWTGRRSGRDRWCAIGVLPMQ
jgi:hypothetical protein